MLAVNVASTTLLARELGGAMAADPAGGGGRLVLVSSISGAAPIPGTVAAYAATKAYVSSLASALRTEAKRTFRIKYAGRYLGRMARSGDITSAAERERVTVSLSHVHTRCGPTCILHGARA